MSNPLHLIFESRGLPRPSRAIGPECPTDESLAGYMDEVLPLGLQRGIEDHALRCDACHSVIQAVIDVTRVPTTARARPARIVARLIQHGMELLNPLELSFRSLRDGALAPALGALRGVATAEEVASHLFSIDGPGDGLDELELQVQPNGSVRLMVRGNAPPPLAPGEVSSIVFEADGCAREKRPFSGAPLTFAPLGPGRYRVQLVARAPGQPVRTLSEASFELQG
jgi:hypothetical protein